MAEKLTDARVRGAPVRASRYSIMDSKEPGLELRIHPDGRRVFALRRSIGGRDVRVTIGPYGQEPPAFTLEAARGEAAALKVRFRSEGDFRGAERDAQRAERDARAHTVDHLCDDWLKHASRRLRASTLALHKHRIDKHVKPAFGTRTLDTVSRADVRALIASLEDRPRTANTVAQLLAQLYRFARSELERDVPNPAADLKPLRESARQRFLSDAEIKTFWEALANPDLPPGPQIATALRLCLYSCQRSGEVIGARDDELDFDEGVWRVPGERTKSGKPNTIPLTPKLVALLRQAQALRRKPPKAGETQEPLPANAPVFPAPGDLTKPMLQHSLSTAMARLCEELGWETNATPHDLRRTARTVLARERLGVSFEDAERLMSHSFGSKVARTYLVDAFIPQKRRALERLGAELDRIIEGRAIAQTENVVELRTA